MKNHFNREFILPPAAAKLAGLKRAAIYKAMKAKKIPKIVEMVKGKPRIKIPTRVFLVWLDKEIERFQAKVDHLVASRTKLREYING